ncbi:MAG TPA: gfo/Idh/MocA family oxidoreductase [Bacteroidetes bacterium]|nr:Gfo/Idh/MocA family oxidoreductase [Ignavibacteria bacterium]HCA42921.1 gfo/Idh/MocA family oxidoreductase [Bacteroidota bacterium]HCN36848.1 gfo/Idh/MocA family oxidoreductase [Bacteroidota bacterium]
MEKTKIAVIGLGALAQIIHLPCLSKMNDVEIDAICDTDFSKAKKVASRHNINPKKVYKTTDELLKENPEISGVIISAQTNVHKDIAISCLEAGKDILVERPIARNIKEAESIVNTAKKEKRKLMVGMNNRFRYDVMMQRSFVKSKELGDIFFVKTGWLKTRSSVQKWFLEKDKSGGGVVIDNGLAMLDAGLWMLGFPEVYSVSAVNFSHNTKSVEDSNFTMIRFKNGSALNLEVSWSLIREEFFYCNIYGEKGSSSINPLKVFKKMENNVFNITPKNIKMPANLFKNSYELELKHFIGVLKGNDKLISTGDEAIKVMQIIDCIYKSAKSGKEIICK